MKYIPLAVLIAGCGSGSPDSSDGTCKEGRVWDENVQSCVNSDSDASIDSSIDDATVDTGYVQKYEGKLYGIYQNDTEQRFVTFDFQTGKLDQLVSQDGSIISLPSDATGINSAELSPDKTYLLSSLSFNHNESHGVYLFDLRDSSAKYLFPDLSTAQFAWKDNDTYIVSISEAVDNNNNNNNNNNNGYEFARRLYQRHVGDTSTSDWIIQDLGKSEMPVAIGSNNDIVFLCLADGEDPSNSYYAEKEICATTTEPNNHLSKESRGIRGGISFAHSVRLYWPESQLFTVYSPCANNGHQNYLCSLELFEGSAPQIVAQVDSSRLGTAVFDPSIKYVILNSEVMFNLNEGKDEGKFLPLNLEFEGEPFSRVHDLQWISWRHD